jgi:hypothetical protein
LFFFKKKHIKYDPFLLDVRWTPLGLFTFGSAPRKPQFSPCGQETFELRGELAAALVPLAFLTIQDLGELRRCVARNWMMAETFGNGGEYVL